jgi:hypothetical protein
MSDRLEQREILNGIFFVHVWSVSLLYGTSVAGQSGAQVTTVCPHSDVFEQQQQRSHKPCRWIRICIFIYIYLSVVLCCCVFIQRL